MSQVITSNNRTYYCNCSTIVASVGSRVVFYDKVVHRLLKCAGWFGLLFLALFFSVLVSSCANQRNESGTENVDELNSLAYRFYYVSLDSVEKYAGKAFDIAQQCKYDDGIYEALCNLAFAKYMRLDYVPAQDKLQLVLDNSDNILYKFVADVILMRICQRRSENNDYYVYYNEAIKNRNRIQSDIDNMLPRQNFIFNFALSEFAFANSVYNYYSHPDTKNNDDLDFVMNNLHIVENDSAQEAMLYFLIGNSRIIDEQRPKENVDYLIKAAALAKNSNINYVLAKALSSIAEDLAKPNCYNQDDIAYIRNVLVECDDSLNTAELPLAIAYRALEDFEEYGSLFDVSQTYIAIAEYYIENGDAEQAVNNMVKALDCVNEHHKIVADDGDVLFPEYNPDYGDSLSVEQKWIRNGVVCVPEWIIDVREHLSLAFALWGHREDSFFNRNIYLDLLKETRQDARMEQVYDTLQKEQSDLNSYMILASAILLMCILASYLLAKKIKQKFIKNYLNEKMAVENEMQRWRMKTDEDFSSLEEKQEMANAEKLSNERRLEEQKRQYINKTTCLAIVYAITPFLDRAVNEVRKLRNDITSFKGEKEERKMKIHEKLEYIDELIQRINLYNDILANWIKIRQGEVALNVEKFELGKLFDIMAKNNRMFLAKNIQLQVSHTDAVVRADRALTLFMINTLLDNARKYTDEGGTVKLFTEENDDYIDIVVQDTGKGMSEQDVNTILQEKVYDANKIGEMNDENLKKNKGFGFGILNCKGIIEKYKKTSDVFRGCKFGLESKLGHGSKFYFRLPTIKKKILALFIAWGCLHSISFASSNVDNVNNASFDALEKDSSVNYKEMGDSIHQKASDYPDDPLIYNAMDYAELAYRSNQKGEWEMALQYADSACECLNDYYINNSKEHHYVIKLYDSKNMPDIDLWNSNFQTDYQTILDLRNEAAIAAMLLGDVKVYKYNNEIYHRLYKLMTSDPLLDNKCEDTQQTITNHKILFVVLIVLVFLGLMIFSFIYYQKNMMPIFELRQILELNRQIFNNEDENRLANIIHEGMDNIRKADGVIVMTGKDNIIYSDACPQVEYIIPILKDAYANREQYVIDNGKNRIYPLVVDNGNCIGSIAFVMHNDTDNQQDDKLFNLIAQYTAINIFYSKVRMEKINDDIEIIQDEKRKAEREGNIVHVQNLVIDNTLSTIKHETMYYPNRIKQIVDKMANLDDNRFEQEKEDYVNTMYELVNYYKEIFTILGDCAAKQILKPMFKRRTIKIATLLEVVKRIIQKYNKKHEADIGIEWNNVDDELMGQEVVADETMLVYLIENVIEAVLSDKKDGSLISDFDKSEDFIKFAFAFEHNNVTNEQLKNMFYPEVLKYDENNDRLIGAQTLLAKQIVREHDEHVRRGCRIYAEHINQDGAGIRISFTIPANRTSKNSYIA